MAGIGEDLGSPHYPCLAHQRRKVMVARDDVLATGSLEHCRRYAMKITAADKSLSPSE